jgi:hypothetical protein
MSTAIITLCGIAFVVLFLGGFLYIVAPDIPEPRNGMPDIGPDGTTENGTTSRRARK